MEIKCNVSNCQFDETEWKRISEVCKSHHHIGQDDDVKDIIMRDEERMIVYGITFEQLEKFFDKVESHYENNEKTKISDTEAKMLSDEFKSIDTDGWCLWGCSKAKIFNDTLTVIKVTWGGAEQCTFQSTNDKNYHGYDYGSHDWFFIKGDKIMHIGDLLFHQIVKHHFFQSPESKYHVDIDKLIEFFGLTKNTDYSTTITKGRVLKLEKCLSREEFTQENIEGMKHEINGENEFYYNDTTVFIVVNNKNTIPFKINGCKHIPVQYNALLSQLVALLGESKNKKEVEKYSVIETDELSPEELSKQW
jgi:hypothetical protein